ncbi:MAG: hypothetical protein DI537_13790 [Stutzerimonas stutzeri]|nr:MAG: hypothetical protein DI537_13790 [Stutzerimonas stutzeri]
MFEPNLVGKLSRRIGRDVHSRAIFAPATDCPFASVNMLIGAEKTSVRADSSASRGSTDEMVATRAKILIANYVVCAIGDRFEFEGATYLLTSRHVRRSVMGNVDHFECDLEIVPA